MLNINSETVCRLIDLAQEFHAQEEVVIPEEPGNPSGDWAVQILASHDDDLTLQEFRSIIDDLEPDQQHELVALMWLGREDYSVAEWQDAVNFAHDCWTSRTADYLIAHPQVADYWHEGLNILGLACE